MLKKLALSIGVLCLLTGKVEANSNIHILDIYNQGYKKGYAEGMLAGYKRAIEDFKKMFNEKLEEYKAIEAGRFLLNEWYISYPKVYQIPTEKGVEIKVEGCSVLRPFDDLVAKISQNIPLLEREIKSREEKESAVKREDEFTKPYVSLIPKKLKEEVVRRGYSYENLVEADHIIVYFPNERAYKQFCSEFDCQLKIQKEVKR